MKYLIYLRVSTNKQDEETQLSHCLNFIKTKQQGEFQYEIFRDKVTSKKKLFDREGGKQLFDSLRKGDIIISIRLDRISRNIYETLQLIDILDKNGSEILLVDQPGIKNKIMLGIYAGMAEEEIKTLRSRVKEKLQYKKEKGERYSRFLPYGQALHETKMVPIRVGDEVVLKRGILIPLYEEQQILSKMYQLSDTGISYQKIADELNRLGCKNREGKPFQKMSIYRILSRRELPKSEDQLQEEKEALASH